MRKAQRTWLRITTSNRGSEIPESTWQWDRRSSGYAFQAGPYETHRQRRLWFGSRQFTSAAGTDFTTPVDDLSRPTRHTVRSSDMNRRTLPKSVVSFSLGGTR